MIGVMIHLLSGLHNAAPLPLQPVPAPEPDELFDDTVAFLAAGLRAPA